MHLNDGWKDKAASRRGGHSDNSNLEKPVQQQPRTKTADLEKVNAASEGVSADQEEKTSNLSGNVQQREALNFPRTHEGRNGPSTGRYRIQKLVDLAVDKMQTNRAVARQRVT